MLIKWKLLKILTINNNERKWLMQSKIILHVVKFDKTIFINSTRNNKMILDCN